MSWVQIKRALNRSLGTKEFKPLDELIKGQKTLIASDNLYSYIGDPSKIWSVSRYATWGTSLEIPYTLKMNTNGSLRLCYLGRTPDSTYCARLRIYKNEVLYKENVLPISVNTYVEQSVDVTFEKNDVFSFALIEPLNNGEGALTKFRVMADVVDGSLLEITNESEE